MLLKELNEISLGDTALTRKRKGNGGPNLITSVGQKHRETFVKLILTVLL